VPDYLLDTMILRYWYDDRCPEQAKVIARVQAVRQADPLTRYVPRLFISVVTLGEIGFGHKVTPTPDLREQSEYLKFVRKECPEPLEITAHVGESYGDLKAWLFDNFRDKTKRRKDLRLSQLVDPISANKLGADENDLWIAAQAMTHNLVLVTHDTSGHFGQLLGHFATMLRVEDWAQ